MTVHQRNEESREPSFPAVSPCSNKNHWPTMENDSSSWDRNSRATSSSWPGDMEEAATRKVLQMWDAIEKNLFGEDDQEQSFDPVSDECNQWKTQLIHLRVIGKSLNPSAIQESNEPSRSSSRKSKASDDRFGEEIIVEDSSYRTQDSNSSTRYPRIEDEQNEVFDKLLEFVCSELTKQDETNDAEFLGTDLDDVLRITPAPTYSGSKSLKGRKTRDNPGSRKTSANEDRKIVAAAVDDPRVNDRLASAASKRTVKSTTNGDVNVNKDEPVVPQVARNKLGTVFNEKIVVSPVPFIVSTRESFTTLRTTPISFRAQTFEISTPQGLGRYMNSASKTNSAQRMSGLRIPQSHSAWQAPVCPTVWPKNVRLAPIDPSRLPSSKNRSTIESPALLQRNRNSLSPISRPLKSVTSAGPRDYKVEGLEIQGKQIVTRPQKQNLKKGWDCSPRNAKNIRTKPRNRTDRQ